MKKFYILLVPLLLLTSCSENSLTVDTPPQPSTQGTQIATPADAPRSQAKELFTKAEQAAKSAEEKYDSDYCYKKHGTYTCQENIDVRFDLGEIKTTLMTADMKFEQGKYEAAVNSYQKAVTQINAYLKEYPLK